MLLKLEGGGMIRRFLQTGGVVLLAGFLLCGSSTAAEKGVWVEATGTAYLGENDTLSEIKKAARRDAQAKAVEQAVGVFIKSHTLVSNSQVAEDLIYAAVRGKLAKVKVLGEGWDDREKNLWTIKVRALVEPSYPEKGGGFSVKATLSKSELKEGDEVRIFYKVSRDCYVYLFSVAADDSVTLLFPNAQQRENLARADQAYEFPPAGSPIRLKAMLLPGQKGKTAEERIKIIATKEKEDLIPLGFQEGMFKVYDARSTGLVSDLVRRLNAIDPADWAQAQAVYTIER